MDAAVTAVAVKFSLDYVLPLIQLGLSHDEIWTTVKGWSDAGMTQEQIADQLVVLRQAKRDKAVQA